jgi:Fur family ferric uptake transcriptional regulator
MRKQMWVDEAREHLKRAGYRPGAAGSLVLEHLAGQSCCRGAQEIHDALRSEGHRVGLASVYRMLDALGEQALVQRVDVGDGVVRYEPARDADHHHHLVCGECGKVEPFADPQLEQAIEAVEQHSGYSVVAHEIVLRGACGDCRAA